jgi:hypothetical protein
MAELLEETEEERAISLCHNRCVTYFVLREDRMIWAPFHRESFRTSCPVFNNPTSKTEMKDVNEQKRCLRDVCNTFPRTKDKKGIRERNLFFMRLINFSH